MASKREIALLREFIEISMLLEGPVPLKRPETKEQQNAFFKLLKWAAEKMQAPVSVVNDAIDAALHRNHWDDAIELLRDFYVMKGIKFQTA